MEIFEYVTSVINAPIAANNLIGKFDKSISRLRDFPFSYPEYRPKVFADTKYRVLVVENYLVFYTILNDVVEIRRILYSKRNINKNL